MAPVAGPCVCKARGQMVTVRMRLINTAGAKAHKMMRVCGDECFKVAKPGSQIIGVAHAEDDGCVVCSPATPFEELNAQVCAARDALLQREYFQVDAFKSCLARYALQREVWICNAVMVRLRRHFPALIQQVMHYDRIQNSGFCSSPFQLLGETEYITTTLYYRPPSRLSECGIVFVCASV